jgi:hypothetical protein
VIVSHRERRITVHQRSEQGEWTARVAIAGGRVAVPSLDAALLVDDIYRKSTLQ